MRTSTLILAAAVVFAGIGSASACSYSGTDIAVNGDGDVVELTDDGYGNQITGHVLGDYHSLEADIEGSCNVIVTRQDGSYTTVGALVEGDNQALGVLIRHGASVDVEMIGDGNQALFDVNGGDFTTVIHGKGNRVHVSS